MIRRLSSGGLIVTYRCSAACRHCLYKSSPRRDKAYMDSDTLRPMLRKASALGCQSFHIGGGEPFLDFDALLTVLHTMREEGVSVDYLETNASWFEDSASAGRLLRELAAAGCRTVMVSICPFHVEFIPLKKAEGVLAACRETGMGYFVWQDQYHEELSRLDPLCTHMRTELEDLYGEDYFLQAAGRYGLTLNGRALKSFASALPSYSADEIIQKNPGGCTELVSTNHFHMDLYGNYIPPGCVGFSLDYRRLGKALDEQTYRRFLIAAREGLSGLFRLAVEESGFSPSETGYVSKCQLCEEIRNHMTGEGFRDLQPEEFYTMV